MEHLFTFVIAPIIVGLTLMLVKRCLDASDDDE